MSATVAAGTRHRLRATFIHAVADFVNACAEGKPVQPTFEDGLKNQRVLTAVEESSRTGKWMKV